MPSLVPAACATVGPTSWVVVPGGTVERVTTVCTARPSAWVSSRPSTRASSRASRRLLCQPPAARSACAWPIARPTSRAPVAIARRSYPSGPAGVEQREEDERRRLAAQVEPGRRVEALREERVDALGGDVDERHVVSGLAQAPPESAAHDSGPYDEDACHGKDPVTESQQASADR